MIQRLRARLTYANVAATLALVLAAGGSSYAALSLPRHSVGPSQLRRGAVTSRALRNHAVHRVDIAPSTRRSLRGQRGPKGRRGPTGPAAVKHFAAVTASGEFVRGDATRGGHTAVGSGVYTVGFVEDVSACVYDATLGSTDETVVPPGRVTVRNAAGQVEVHTFNASGAPADLPFHLIVAC